MYPPQVLGDWCFAADGTEFLADEVAPLDPDDAAFEVEGVIQGLLMRPDTYRWRLVLLRQSAEPARVDWYGQTTRALLAWLREAVADGRVRMQAVTHATLDVASGLDVSALRDLARTWHEFEDKARDIPLPVPAHAAPARASKPSSDIPASHYAGSETDEDLPDETDGTCKRANEFSESYATASPEVQQWFVDMKIDPRFWDSTLGAKGGGGFYRGTTQLVRLPAGTRLCRYYGTGTNPVSTWWTLYTYAGDPRVIFALPVGQTGRSMVVGEIKNDLTGLIGVGAPRCSNKPGGVPQICIPFERAWPNGIENTYIRILSDP